MRLFVAVPLPGPLASQLRAAVAAAAVSGLRETRSENLHVTVHFLGPVDAALVAPLAAALAPACAAVSPYDLEFDAVVPAPSRRPRMLWARAGPSPEHTALVRAVAEAAADAATAARAPRPDSPHVTVARARGRSTGVRVSGPVALDGARLHVRECVLMRSDPGPDGSRYTILARLPLGDQPARRR